MMSPIAFAILCFVAVLSASPIKPESHHPHEFIIAKTDSKDLSGEGKYKIIEIIPFSETENNSTGYVEETTTSNSETNKPSYEDNNNNQENYSDPQKEKYARILEAVKEAVPEEQKYNEQNPEPEHEKRPQNPKEKIEILLKTAKPEVQKYDEQNPDPTSEKQNSENDLPEYKNFEPQYSQDVLTRVIDHTHNGPSYAEIIEIQPDLETLKHYKINTPQTSETRNSETEDSGKPIVEVRKPKYVVPEAPTFTTRISVPPLPISLSSIRSMMIHWPREVPSIFKAPRIIYLRHQ
ncbi:unnamed protein product [Pieris macdunnoughi]|uniref:Uncharacterized protein n=1 Tax=Pieris macdunnoughi TaxID=345717 RepID=A0A821N1N2_9NEOP|nr:unnamed protein product [Pieris macdunnoughi]CAF4778371.1 unnamed protein product [Pieris macdunnoughi]